MKDEIRLFVAAPLPEQLKAFLQDQMQNFKHPSVRLVPEQNLHLTLFFIGNAPKSDLPVIRDKLHQLTQARDPFSLNYLCTEPGPNPRSPRLIWARFEQHPEFEKLSKALTQALAPGQKQKLKPIPHITLARYKKETTAPPFAPITYSAGHPNLAVDSIALWQSELASPHPIYTILETYPLATKP